MRGEAAQFALRFRHRRRQKLRTVVIQDAWRVPGPDDVLAQHRDLHEHVHGTVAAADLRRPARHGFAETLLSRGSVRSYGGNTASSSWTSDRHQFGLLYRKRTSGGHVHCARRIGPEPSDVPSNCVLSTFRQSSILSTFRSFAVS